MKTILTIAAGAGLAAGLGAAAAAYLGSRLRGILVDLCGTEPRAEFWMSFSNLVLVMSPVVLALFGYDFGEVSAPRAVVGLGLTLSRYADGRSR